jgi:hypothetical protein
MRSRADLPLHRAAFRQIPSRHEGTKRHEERLIKVFAGSCLRENQTA